MSKNLPPASSEAASKRMRANRRKDTAPEIALMRLLDEHQIPYEHDIPPLAASKRRADIVFREQRIAVFVDGCFWHGCPLHGTWPKQNADFWKAKIETNQQRDRSTDAQLAHNGWLVIRAWAHEEPDAILRTISATLAARNQA